MQGENLGFLFCYIIDFLISFHAFFSVGKFFLLTQELLDLQKKSKLLLKSKLGKLKRRKDQSLPGEYFSSGAKVEVRSDEEGYRGFWYPALIGKDLGDGKFSVQYQTLKTDDETQLLKEEADAPCIRPAPPVVQHTGSYRPLENVDAWHNKGWWVGEVCKVLEGPKYSVYFQESNKVLEFLHSDLRPHQDWINKRWIHTIRVWS